MPRTEKPRAGRMDEVIVLQTAERTRDAAGAEVLVWPPDGGSETTLFAEWLPAGTSEAWRAQQRLGSYIEGVFRIYQVDPRPTPDDTRILYNGFVFDIKPPIDIGRGTGDGLEIPVVAHGE